MDNYTYAGGCFKDGLHYTTKVADPGTIYKFEDVEVEVRNFDDPIIQAGKMSDFSYSYGTGVVAI